MISLLRHILPALLIIFSSALHADNPRKLRISFSDGSATLLTLSGEIMMRPSLDGSRLEVSAPLGLFELPLAAVTEFGIVGPDGGSSSGLGSQYADVADTPWAIYSLSGRMIASGRGEPEAEELAPATVYLLRRGNVTLKFTTR